MSERPWGRAGLARTVTFVAGWLLVSATMVAMHLRAGMRAGGGDPSHDGAGALAAGLAITAVELAVLLAIIRPWSYRRAWWRALGACVLFAPASVVAMVAALHVGAIASLHAFWLFALTGLLAVATVWSLGAAYRHGPTRTQARPA